jgi:protein-tyrosine phosphatase
MWDHGRPQDPAAWGDAAEFAAAALDDPSARVLIHCQRGRRRSAMLAYAVLRVRGMSPEDATRAVLFHRRESELVPTYLRNVEDWLRARSGPPDDRREGAGGDSPAPH